ncbi:HAD family hydrolase [Sulfurospirillum diekertiae]|uniref:Pyrimidine 5'-nucleotidase YjjG n=1 Tax=Sulfurospirillum diekertiae TaxID=1854492 RepID=A0A1Y0HN34_9BACT|nr:HAD family hydrolase [Sulfurospirillum diekertiae]ARU49518.1 Pyrimidine 5'-nucleotidase YjjG [Sulfurospirillum diekertiae]ASC94322.1 Pyrimidine 5'-nucleotidase YjjG [Sulfurospirillum diekertiae]
MRFEGILLDIDNTIYHYESCHKKANQAVLDFVLKEVKIADFENAFIKARRDVHIELAETASSHNRLLYFQKTCEYVGINPLSWAAKFYNVYWDTFLDSIELYSGVFEFFEDVSPKYTICFVTDLTACIQYRKIEKFGLSKYVSHIVTSEEAGREKPHPYMFLSALNKLNMNPNQVCMIGDSYQKDIIGASSLGIQSIWLNSKSKQENYNKKFVTEIKEFKEILGLL